MSGRPATGALTRLRHLGGSGVRRIYRKGFRKVPFGPLRGKEIYYDKTMNVDMVLGFHEPNTFKVMRQLVVPGATVVDIGAHRGYFTVFLDELVGPTGRVIAFEPSPDNYPILTDTISVNQCTRTIAEQAAVARERGMVDFYLSHTHYMSSLDGRWAGEEGGVIQVKALSLDEYFAEEIKGPDFIKMDIEGGGVSALPGMQRTIERFQPHLLLESHTPAEDRAIGAVFAAGAYDCYRVGKPGMVTHFDADYRDPMGVSETVVGVARARGTTVDPEHFQKRRLGQR